MLLELNDLSKSYGSDTVFSGVRARLEEGDKIGLVGLNGCGKSTLLKIICGLESADEGRVSTKKKLSLGFLKQDLGLDADNTIYEEALRVFDDVIKAEQELERRRIELENTKDLSLLEKLNTEYLKLLESFEENRGLYYRSVAASALMGLGFTQDKFSEKISHLSGGQKMRVALAKLLTSRPDIILLDEPTNYLDAASIQWLEAFLGSYPKAYIVVSHDRYFLDKVTNRIWELDGLLTAYNGNYGSYVKQRDEAIYAQERAYKIQSDYIKQQREVIRKLKSYNREKSVKRAESREKLLNKIEPVNKPSAHKTASIHFDTKKVISKNALTILDMSVGYGSKSLISGITIEVKKGEKIGICGRNATGKTTLLKTLSGAISPLAGEFVWGAGASCAYFKQQHEDLDANATLVDYLCDVSGENTLKVRSVLGALLFGEDEVYKKISVLSGGEISRVAVAKLMLSKSNVLLLDEPTNHLDIASKEVFEEAIRGFDGTVLVVSHDRYLLNTVCERIMYIDEGHCDVYDCGYEEASAQFLQTEQKVKQKKESSDASLGKKETISKNMVIRSRKRLQELETEIEKAEKTKLAMENEINSGDFYKDSAEASEKLLEYNNFCESMKSMEEEWLALSEKLENIE